MAGVEENPYEAPQTDPESLPNGFARFFRAAGWLALTWAIVPLALAGIAAALSAIMRAVK
jgi:hypothetical protein